MAVTNVADGSIAQQISYDEFGAATLVVGDEIIPFAFAGGLVDWDTGLVRFGARDYDAEVGRWTAKDPIGFGGGDTNLYGYVFGDPVNGIDPSGEIVHYLAAIAIGGVASALVSGYAYVKTNQHGTSVNPGRGLLAAVAGGFVAGATAVALYPVVAAVGTATAVAGLGATSAMAGFGVEAEINPRAGNAKGMIVAGATGYVTGGLSRYMPGGATWIPGAIGEIMGRQFCGPETNI